MEKVQKLKAKSHTQNFHSRRTYLSFDNEADIFDSVFVSFSASHLIHIG
jgi:hypothetical protein